MSMEVSTMRAIYRIKNAFILICVVTLGVGCVGNAIQVKNDREVTTTTIEQVSRVETTTTTTEAIQTTTIAVTTVFEQEPATTIFDYHNLDNDRPSPEYLEKLEEWKTDNGFE
jgi:hypothetical protein